VSPVAALELVGLGVTLLGIGAAATGRPAGLRAAWPIVIALLFATGLEHASEAAEWMGDETVGHLGEDVAVLVPALWLFLFFTSPRERLLETVASKEEQIRLVLEAAPVPLAILDRDLRYTAASAAWRALLHPDAVGTLEHHALGEACAGGAAFLCEGIDDAVALGRSVGSQDPVEIELGHRTEWIRWLVSPWFAHPDELGGVVVLLDVVSEQLRADEEARAMQEQLQRVNRTDLVALVSSGVAHDVRNFLLVVGAHAELLRAPAVTADELEESTRAIQQATDAATKLLGTLTDLSRKRVAETQRVDLGAITLQARRILERSLPPTVQLVIDCDRGAPILVTATPIKIQQILLNLVVNARDAMPEGGEIRLGVGTEGGRAYLSVRDRGQGIAPEIQGRIFEYLFTTKEPGRGTGLGLAIVRSIVDEYDGTIEVASTPGEGTRFDIRLPLAS